MNDKKYLQKLIKEGFVSNPHDMEDFLLDKQGALFLSKTDRTGNGLFDTELTFRKFRSFNHWEITCHIVMNYHTVTIETDKIGSMCDSCQTAHEYHLSEIQEMIELIQSKGK